MVRDSVDFLRALGAMECGESGQRYIRGYPKLVHFPHHALGVGGFDLCPWTLLVTEVWYGNLEVLMTIVLTWATCRWLVIPLIILFLFGLTGILPDNPLRPVRAGIALISGVLLLAFLVTTLVRGFFF